MNAAPLLLLLGGSFNPPHAGHMRIAVECAEVLKPARVLFIPCAVPPHKEAGSLLPFALRCAMLRAAIGDMRRFTSGPARMPDFAVSEVENERAGPSYTVDTLAVLGRRYPDFRPAFIMGGEDYDKLSTWRQWPELPDLADLVVVPRNREGEPTFIAQSRNMWPQATPCADAPPGAGTAFVLPGGGRLLFLPQPLLDISSSLVRERFLSGRALDFLVPPGVNALLQEKSAEIKNCWNK